MSEARTPTIREWDSPWSTSPEPSLPKGHVQIHRAPLAILRDRLLRSGAPPATAARAEHAALVLLDVAEWRKEGRGKVDMTKAQVNALLGVTDKTGKRVRGLLAWAGFLVYGSDDWHVSACAYEWLTGTSEDGPLCMGEVMEDPTLDWGPIPWEELSGAGLAALEAKAAGSGIIPSRAGRIRNHSESHPESFRAGPGTIPSPPTQMAGKKEEVKNPTQEGPGGLLATLDQRVPGSAQSPGVAREVDRLHGDLWTDQQILERVGDLSAARDPGLIVDRLRRITGPSPAQVAAREAASNLSRKAAPECVHGCPNGTWDGDGKHWLGWRLCEQCREPEPGRSTA